MKLILVRRTGQLDWELQRTLAPLGEVHALGPDELDLSDLKALDGVMRSVKPQIVVNASAYTAVDRAEQEPDLAMRINAHAPGVMAETARALGAVLLHYATDYVFDGTKNTPYTEDDPVNPLNTYGQSKLGGEQAIGQVGGAHLILRTSWVYSLRGDGFVTKTLSWARRQETLRIVTDQVGSPTWARMLAEVSAALIARGLPVLQDYFLEKGGVYHLGGAGVVSRFEFARRVLQLDPRPEEQIVHALQPALMTEFPTPAHRPLFTPLDCSRFEQMFGVHLPGWDNTLELAMDDLKIN